MRNRNIEMIVVRDNEKTLYNNNNKEACNESIKNQ